jgi:phage-related protein
MASSNFGPRMFYFGAERDINFVHGIIKKTRKVPREDIEIAKKRRTEIQSSKVRKNALPN